MPLRDCLIGLTISLLWGYNFVVMKVGVGEIPPLVLAASRFTLAALPLVFFVPRPVQAWRWVVTFGLLFGTIKFTLLFWGLRLGMPAGLTAVVLQTQVVLTMVLASRFLGERASTRQLVSAAIAVGGLAVMATEWAAEAPILPFGLVLLAALAWAFANIASKRATGADPFAFTVWSSLIAAIPLVLLAIGFEGWPAIRASFGAMTWRGGGAILYLAYPVALLSVAMWNALLQRHSAAALAPFALLVPVVGLSLGHLLLGETISRVMLVGAGLVLAGLIIGMMGPRASARVRSGDVR